MNIFYLKPVNHDSLSLMYFAKQNTLNLPQMSIANAGVCLPQRSEGTQFDIHS